MIEIRKNVLRLVAFAAIGCAAAVSVMGSAPAYAVPVAPHDDQHDWARQRQEFFKKRVDAMANRLEIKASQQGAWQTFVGALEAAADWPATPAEAKTDAASIARRHAERAAAWAQKLGQIADATAKLQQVLDPEQRKTLDQIAAHFEHRGHHFHHGDNEHAKHGFGDRQRGDEEGHQHEQH